MSNPKTELSGEIAKIEKKDGKKNPFYILDILVTVTDFNDESKEVVYQVTALGKQAEKAAGLKAGDYVVITAYVESREYQGRHYTSLRAGKIDVQSNAVPKEEANSQTDDGQQATGEAGDLPF